jgi:transposase
MTVKIKEHSIAKRSAVVTWRKAGRSLSEISKLEGLPRSTVQSILGRYQKNPQSLANKERPGRPPKLSERAKGSLIRAVAIDTHLPIRALGTPTKTAGTHISEPIVRKTLKEYGLSCRKARTKSYLSKEHRKARVKWCRDHKMWQEDDWKRVIWTDEVTFELSKDSRTIWVTRRVSKEYLPKNLKPSFKSDRVSISAWGAVCNDKIGPLICLLKGKRMNADTYTNRILKQHLKPFWTKIKKNHKRKQIYTMDDGATCHTAKVSVAWRAKNKMPRMPWPAQSPDLNPIENLWAILKRKINIRKHRIRDIEELQQVIHEEWARLSAKEVGRCTASMKKRIMKTIQNKGGPTKY